MAQTLTTPTQTERSKPATGQETVIIGCKLPSGITLEVGLQTLGLNSDGKRFTQVKRLDNYERIVLKGWHHHNTTGLQLPAGTNMRPFLNRGISKAAWEEWKRTHENSWLIKNGILFEAAGEAEAQSKALDAMEGPAVFAPLDPTKPTIPGVSKADFKE
jgi:hypothetical protein